MGLFPLKIREWYNLLDFIADLKSASSENNDSNQSCHWGVLDHIWINSEIRLHAVLPELGGQTAHEWYSINIAWVGFLYDLRDGVPSLHMTYIKHSIVTYIL